MPKPNPLYPPLQVFVLSLFKAEFLFTSLPCSTPLRHLFLQEDFLFSTSEHVLSLSFYILNFLLLSSQDLAVLLYAQPLAHYNIN